MKCGCVTTTTAGDARPCLQEPTRSGRCYYHDKMKHGLIEPTGVVILVQEGSTVLWKVQVGHGQGQ